MKDTSRLNSNGIAGSPITKYIYVIIGISASMTVFLPMIEKSGLNFLTGEAPSSASLHSTNLQLLQMEAISTSQNQSLELLKQWYTDTRSEAQSFMSNLAQDLVKQNADATKTGMQEMSEKVSTATAAAVGKEKQSLSAGVEGGEASAVCLAPYVSQTIKREDRVTIEGKQMAWYKGLDDALQANLAQTVGHKVWQNLFLPTMDGCKMERYGGQTQDTDGGKWICGMQALGKVDSCVIYSLGSANDWSFETAMYKNTKCRIETFDCTVDASVPSDMQDRVRFHKVCLGDDSVIDGREFKTLKSLTQMLGDTSVDLLKMDIEDGEFPVFRAMFRDDWSVLPAQISVEMHYWPTQTDQRFGVRSPEAAAVVAERLHTAGYRSFSREENYYGNCCTEFTLIRLKCPEDKYLEVPRWLL